MSVARPRPSGPGRLREIVGEIANPPGGAGLGNERAGEAAFFAGFQRFPVLGEEMHGRRQDGLRSESFGGW